MRFKYLAIWVFIGNMIVSGCSGASPAMMENMIVFPVDLENYNGNSILKHNLVVKEVLGGKETNWWGSSQIGNKEFKGALIKSLESAQLLSPHSTGNYELTANLIFADQPVMGFDMTVTTVAKYIVVQSGTNSEIYNKVIRTPYTAKSEDAAWSGVKRLRLANEGSARQNITKLIEELYHLK